MTEVREITFRSRDLREIRQHVVLDAVREMFVLLVVAEIIERQNRDRLFDLPAPDPRKEKKSGHRRQHDPDCGEQINISPLRPECGRAFFIRNRRRCLFETVRTDIEGPAMTSAIGNPAKSARIIARTAHSGSARWRKNRRRDLDQQPADDSITRRDAIDFAPPKFTEKSIQPCVQFAEKNARGPLLYPGRKNRLEMRALFFARDDGDFDFAEAAFFQPLVQLHFAEA